MKRNRVASFAIIAVIYIVAVGIGLEVFRLWSGQLIYLDLLAADLAATVFVYLAGLVLGNASVYDPYWSVAPIVICTGLAVAALRLSPGLILLLLVIWYWGVRLTANWAYTFPNLAVQDWRYDQLQAQYPRLYPLICLVGITVFPTVVVYLCLLPAVAFLRVPAFNALTVVGFVICLGAVTLQLVADVQMQRFRRRHAGQHQIIRQGLWTHARHPNYLGEILMWWGVYVMMLSASPRLWYFGAGALVNTAMFVFVSIPMADKRNQATRPGWEEYRRQTNALLPIRLRRARV